jgi:hypothetical protein
MYGQKKRVSRAELYEAVWSKPTVQLAGEYGLSDVGLAKICRRLDIPVPGRGYWRKKEAGQDVPKLPLPPLKPGKMDYAKIDVDATKPLEPQVQGRVDFEMKPDNLIMVRDDPAEFCPLAASAWHSLQRATFDQRGLAVGEDEWAKIVRVSKDNRARAARILNALLEAFRARGFQAATESKWDSICVEIDGSVAAFRIEEAVDRKVKELTPAQEKDKQKNPWRYTYPQYVYVPSGAFTLKITHPSWNLRRVSWSDGTRQQLEHSLNSFVIGLIKAAEADRLHRIEAEKRRVEEEERKRLEAIWRRRKTAEERQMWALLTDSVSWRYSQNIRAFVQAVKVAASWTAECDPADDPVAKWTEWALHQADLLDPLAPGAYCTQADRYDGSGETAKNVEDLHPRGLVWDRMLRRSEYYEGAAQDWHRRTRW